MKRLFFLFLMLSLSAVVSAQTDRSEVRAGNRKFRKGAVKQAEIDYRKAVVKDSLSLAGEYNLASALYRQKDYEGASKALQTVKDTACASSHASDYHYNSGDVALQKKDYAAAVEAFRRSLLLNPGDIDAKENYVYAKKMLQNQQNGGGGDNNQNQNQDQDQDQQDRNRQDQDSDQNQDQDQDNGQQPQPQDGQISPQQAQQILKAVQAQEQKTRDKVEKEKADALQSRQKEKNW